MPQLSPLGPPDSDHFIAGISWLQRGDAVRAGEELDKIAPPLHLHPDVLEIRWRIHVMRADWQQALHTGDLLVASCPERPESWLACSQALHALGRTQDAWDKLLAAAERFPRHSLLFFNLACYACVLGDLDEARRRLKQAIALGEAREIKQMALEEADLKPLWPEVVDW